MEVLVVMLPQVLHAVLQRVSNARSHLLLDLIVEICLEPILGEVSAVIGDPIASAEFGSILDIFPQLVFDETLVV
jgi:hypothetical protein